ncbi:MAG: DUF6788 family protein [Planctomycetota bacterium]|jgi:hypothetical protein
MSQPIGKSRKGAAVDSEWMARGSLVRLQRRCGKTNCHCHDGQPHLTWALSYSVKGKTKMITLRDRDLSRVRRALGRYKRAAADLENKAMKGIVKLSQQLRHDKQKEQG